MSQVQYIKRACTLSSEINMFKNSFFWGGGLVLVECIHSNVHVHVMYIKGWLSPGGHSSGGRALTA